MSRGRVGLADQAYHWRRLAVLLEAYADAVMSDTVTDEELVRLYGLMAEVHERLGERLEDEWNSDQV